jgi:2-polyprenyl-3-methyl-5-hydroxy-6-metoxy-1,4-benzoquinol methylase
MASVEEHYDKLLAPYYSWIFGGSDLKIEEYREFFNDHGIRPKSSGVAVDLGAGSGFQSIPLAESGFNVIALDTNRQLLAELKEKAGDLPIATIRDDMLNFVEHSPAEIEIIVCMGDSLTHLQSQVEVQQLLDNTYPALTHDGILVLSFRDMTRELTGLDRFIPVRSDATRIFTCFLEYETRHVKVHDIVYEKIKDQWKMKKSAFRKLRIAPQGLNEILVRLGFKVTTFDIQMGLVTIVARK